MKDDGGPAFPRDSFRDGEAGLLITQNGMTLRDWFAGQVCITGESSPDFMAGIVGRRCPGTCADPIERLKFEAEYEAIVRGIKADAMLSEREKE